MLYGIELKDVLLVLIGLPFAVVISWYFFKRGLGRKQIVYLMNVQDILTKGAQYPALLKITYGERTIDVLTKAEIYLWNGGNQPIVAADLNTNESLRIVWPDEFEVLEYSISYQTRATNKVAIDADSNISFEYLNVNDGAIIEVVGTRPGRTQLRGERYGEIKGEIIGAELNPLRQTFELKRSYIWRALLGLALTVGVVYTYTKLVGSQRDWFATIIVGYAGVMSTIMVAVIAFSGVFDWFAGYRMPINLVHRSHRRMGVIETLKLYF